MNVLVVPMFALSRMGGSKNRAQAVATLRKTLLSCGGTVRIVAEVEEVLAIAPLMA